MINLICGNVNNSQSKSYISFLNSPNMIFKSFVSPFKAGPFCVSSEWHCSTFKEGKCRLQEREDVFSLQTKPPASTDEGPQAGSGST